MSSTLVQTPSVEDSVNTLFSNIDQGFVNAHNEPAMTTPSAIVTQTLVVGSTICLVC